MVPWSDNDKGVALAPQAGHKALYTCVSWYTYAAMSSGSSCFPLCSTYQTFHLILLSVQLQTWLMVNHGGGDSAGTRTPTTRAPPPPGGLRPTVSCQRCRP